MCRRLSPEGQIHNSAELMVKYLVLHGARPTTMVFYDFMKLCTKPKNYSMVKLYLLAALDVNKGDYDDRYCVGLFVFPVFTFSLFLFFVGDFVELDFLPDASERRS
jgi:hypothetical protein